MNEYLAVAPEVADALASGRPVVALESTLISHGFPYPVNVEVASEAERIVRDAGAVPATIAILGGRLRVGLTAQEIEHLGKDGPDEVAKASRRDLAPLVARGADGATTVAGTMAIAAMVGIEVFATGGIGGVHRGAEQSFDISADLIEFERTPVAVVCSGAKAVLDLPHTLEVLETHGVTVIGHQTDEFPAFYTRTTGLPVDMRCDSADEIAAVLQVRKRLGLEGGVVVANPIPAEHEIERSTLDGWIYAALEDAAEAGVHGRDVTPFLLARLHELSGGATDEANTQLVYSNARLAAQIASALSTA